MSVQLPIQTPFTVLTRVVVGHFRLDRQLVFEPDVTPLDSQGSAGVDADECTRARHLIGVEPDRSIVEFGDRRLDLAGPDIDLFGQLLGFGVLGLEPVQLVLKRRTGGHLLGRHRRLLAAQLTQAVGMAIGKRQAHLGPLPAFGLNGRSGFVQPFAHH